VKRAKELSAVAIRQLKAPGYYSVGGVGGLLLCVKESGAKSWILRYSTGLKRISKNGKPYPVLRDMGLGPFPDVGLGDAREEARKMKAMLREGLDPIEERRKLKATLIAELEKRRTFAEVCEQFFKVKAGELIPKNAQHWRRSIERYALPVIGSKIVADIETRHIEAILQPIWAEKNVTATALRGRLESVLSFATVKGYRSGDNPARWKDNLKELLPKPSKVHKVKHHRALSIDDTPEFMKALRKRTQGNAARALELAVLTAARSGEVRGALWSEIDLKRKRWTIPAERMKMDRPHIVPLSDAAVLLLEAQPRGNDLVFPSPMGGQLSDMALLAVLKRMDYYSKTTVHGFRAVFKSWGQERTDTPHFVSEMALAHSVGDGIQQAYQRSDLAAKRLKLMREWSRFLGYAEKGAKVVQMEARG